MQVSKKARKEGRKQVRKDGWVQVSKKVRKEESKEERKKGCK